MNSLARFLVLTGLQSRLSFIPTAFCPADDGGFRSDIGSVVEAP